MKNLKSSSLLLGGLLALAAVGCNTTLTLDSQVLEQKISQDFLQQTQHSLTGANLVITVTQTDNAGNVHWSVTG